MSSMAATNALVGDVFFLDDFAIRQWDDPSYQGTKITYDKADFVKKVHEYHKAGAALVDGYAPFCKHVFVPNFVGASTGSVRITPENRVHIETAYQARHPGELAVLARWIPAERVQLPEAAMLDVILYSRKQIVKEYEAMPAKGSPADVPDAPWGIISIKAQDEDYETPMQPITMMRNALGREEGGSGVPLDKAQYVASVEYWRDRVPVI